MHFHERMRQRQAELGQALCVGLDPDHTKIPERYLSHSRKAVTRIYYWMMDVIDATAAFASCFKLQSAYYERLGPDGLSTMLLIIQYIKKLHPNIPVILDCKRGDIDRTQQQYREAAFLQYDADAANVSPYMGREPLVHMYDNKYPERGIISLVYTSNKGARQVQDVHVVHPETSKQLPYWLYIAECTINWAKEVELQNLGFVMAAAHEKNGSVCAEHLRLARALDGGSVQYLVPGFGTQGGYVEATIAAGWAGWGSLYLSSSSGITNAECPKEAARVLSEQIGEAIAKST